MNVSILVPNPKFHYQNDYIAKGSAIVAGEFEDGCRRVYYEGNVFGAVNMHEFDERLLVASYRLRDKAPTTSFLVEPETDVDLFVKVGEFDLSTKSLIITNKNKLDEWVSSYEKH